MKRVEREQDSYAFDVMFRGTRKAVEVDANDGLRSAVLAALGLDDLREWVVVARDDNGGESIVDDQCEVGDVAARGSEGLEVYSPAAWKRHRDGEDSNGDGEFESDEEIVEVKLEGQQQEGEEAALGKQQRDTLQFMRDVETLVHDIAGLANELQVPELAQTLTQSLAEARDKVINWVFVGPLGVGKSELVNRVCMAEWAQRTEAKLPLPSYRGAQSLTRHITRVFWCADAWKVTVTMEDGTVIKLHEQDGRGDPDQRARAVHTQLRGLTANLLARYPQWTEKQLEEDVKVVDVCGPFKGLAELPNVVLTDTPGLNPEGTGRSARQQKRFLEAVHQAGALMIVSQRIEALALKELVARGAFSGKTAPAVVCCAFFSNEHDVSGDRMVQYQEDFRKQVRSALLADTGNNDTVKIDVLRDIKHTRDVQLASRAVVFHRNTSLRYVQRFVEAVRRVVMEASLVTVRECYSVLWFALSRRAPRVRAKHSSKKKDRDGDSGRRLAGIKRRLASLMKRTMQSADARWGVPTEVASAEGRCARLWFLVTSEREPDDEERRKLLEFLSMLGEQIIAYGRSAIDQAARFIGSNILPRVVQGGRGAYTAFSLEPSEEQDAADAEDNDDVLSEMPAMVRRQGSERYEEVVEDLRSEIYAIARRCVESGSGAFEQVDENDLEEAQKALSIRFTKPCMDVTQQAVRKSLESVRLWIVEELGSGSGSAEIPNVDPQDIQTRLRALLKRVKRVYKEYMLNAGAQFKVPKTSLLDTEAVRDTPEDIVTELNKHMGDDMSAAPTRVMPRVLNVGFDMFDETLDARVLRLQWDEVDDKRVQLLKRQQSWQDIGQFSQRCRQELVSKTISKDERDDAKRMRILSPIFCFSVANSEKSMTCKDLFEGHPDEHLTERLVIYVIYEDQLAWFISCVRDRKSTYLMTMPSDARLQVGQEAAKLLCEKLGFAFAWIVPPHLTATSRFFSSVMVGRVCSPACMFYNVEEGHFRRLWRHVLAKAIQRLKSESLIVFNALATTRDRQLQEKAMPLISRLVKEEMIDVADVYVLADALEASAANAEEGAQATANAKLVRDLASALRFDLRPLKWLSEIQVRHGRNFLVCYLQAQQPDERPRTFRMRMHRKGNNTGVLLLNVSAFEPLSFFLDDRSQGPWEAHHLREYRPTSEREFYEFYLENLNRVLGTVANAQVRGLINDQYMWQGVRKVGVVRKVKAKKKNRKPSSRRWDEDEEEEQDVEQPEEDEEQDEGGDDGQQDGNEQQESEHDIAEGQEDPRKLPAADDWNDSERPTQVSLPLLFWNNAFTCVGRCTWQDCRFSIDEDLQFRPIKASRERPPDNVPWQTVYKFAEWSQAESVVTALAQSGFAASLFAIRRNTDNRGNVSDGAKFAVFTTYVHEEQLARNTPMKKVAAATASPASEGRLKKPKF